jgi:multiple sugar transport system substrate-binding protein
MFKVGSLLLGVTLLFLFLIYPIAAATRRTISYWPYPNDVDAANPNQLLEGFSKRNPNIRVEVVLNEPQQFSQRLSEAMASGTLPDVFLLTSWGQLDFISDGSVRNLRSYIDKDSQFNRDIYYASFLRPFSYREGIYAIPRDFFTTALFYNKDIFDGIDLGYPDETWTWSDFTARADRIRRNMPNIWPYAISTGIDGWAPAVWQNRGDIFDATGTQYLLDRPEAFEALQWYADLIHRRRYAPSVTEMFEQGGNLNMFKNGRLAMVSLGAWAIPELEGRVRFRWGIAPPFRGDRVAAFFVSTTGYVISATARDPDAAWEFIKYASAPEKHQRLIDARGNLGYLPAVRGIRETQLNRPFLQIANSEYARSVPLVRRWNSIYEAIVRNLNPLWSGERTAREAVSGARSEVERILSSR